MIRAAVLTCVLCVPLCAAAHETHAALAEIEHVGGHLQVAFYTTLDDIRGAVPELTGDALSAYMARHFVVSAGGKPRPMKWVGHETKTHDAWLYFEIPLASMEGATLRCTALFERSARQVTTINLRAAQKTLATLVFTPGAPEHALR